VQGSVTWQRRAARLGWVAFGLTVLAIVLLALAVWLVSTQTPPLFSEAPAKAVALLPVDVELKSPRVSVVLGVAAAVAGFFVGMVALHAAGAMRVLSGDRHVSDPLPGRSAQMARRILGPVASRSLSLDLPPDWPLTAIPPDASAPTVARCTVLIPAHDEEAVIGLTLASLAAQTRRPDRVVVVADNCTDGTVRIARSFGVEVHETLGNTEHKAGALNQMLGRLLPGAGIEEVVLVMDADSTITPDFLEVALGLLDVDPDLMAVGGLFSGEDGAGILGQLQRNEYTRYQRVIGRREGRLFVLTGTASVFRTYALRAVAEARGSLIPGRRGDVYDALAMTEDNELTLALKSLGASLTSPPQCRVTTEVMGTWRDLFRQRLRWMRGALENVGAYGFTRTTSRYWGQQLALGYGVVALNSYLLLMALALLSADSVRWSPFWLAIGAIFLLERVLTAWRAGWRGRLVALPLVVELWYSLFLQSTYLTSIGQIAVGRRGGWI
jgi:cellulose synthase/poly-beta-1,6-N-acetylglucosamine synthase-like glycosyltransferase